MTQQAAYKRLLKEVAFLGFDNLGDLVSDIEQSPHSYPLSVLEAYNTYKENY